MSRVLDLQLEVRHCRLAEEPDGSDLVCSAICVEHLHMPKDVLAQESVHWSRCSSSRFKWSPEPWSAEGSDYLQSATSYIV